MLGQAHGLFDLVHVCTGTGLAGRIGQHRHDRLDAKCARRLSTGDGDLGKLRWAAFVPGQKKCFIDGVLTNFVGEADTRLRTPPGKKIMYDPEINPQLSNTVFRLPDLGGTPMTGGFLFPISPAGLVVIFR